MTKFYVVAEVSTLTPKTSLMDSLMRIMTAEIMKWKQMRLNKQSVSTLIEILSITKSQLAISPHRKALPQFCLCTTLYPLQTARAITHF